MILIANRTIKHSSKKAFQATLLVFMIPALLSLSACGKSEAELCIDQKSHLWNAKANTKEENKVYWSAVSQCREKHP